MSFLVREELGGSGVVSQSSVGGSRDHTSLQETQSMIYIWKMTNANNFPARRILIPNLMRIMILTSAVRLLHPNHSLIGFDTLFVPLAILLL